MLVTNKPTMGIDVTKIWWRIFIKASQGGVDLKLLLTLSLTFLIR
jgi:hypothetical protein